MYDLLVKLMLISALLQIGMTFKEFQNCSRRECLTRLEKFSRKSLEINWKSISVFPEEAKRFR